MRRLLVVDDEPQIRWRVQHMVRGFDFAWDSIAASNGRQALEILTVDAVDLVLTDIRMPDIDGLALLEELRGRGDRALVALLSAYADFAYAKQALHYGAMDYLVKPLDPAELRRLLLRADELLALEASVEPADALRSGNRTILQTRLVTDLLEGSLPAEDWRARARVLGLTSLGARVISIDRPSAAHDALVRCVRDELSHAGDALAPLVISWDRRHVSIVVLTRQAPEVAPPGDEDAVGIAVVRALRRCSIPELRVGVGGLYRVEDARASYLESLSRLHERAGAGDDPDQLACSRASATASAAGQRAVQQACAWMAAHYAQPITLTETARVVHLHPKYLSTMFPLVTGCGFGEYLTTVRIDKAKALLLDAHIPCHAIAKQVGYQNERCFAQAFRRWTGLNPTEYRQAHNLRSVVQEKSLTLDD